MSGFSADWLSLRAPADARARDPAVAAGLRAAFAGREGLRILDIGAGTGGNMALTAPLLPDGQHWVLADRDSALLARAAPPPGVRVERRVVDLAAEVEALLAPPPNLVTASAFFDLAGSAWLDRFVAALAAAGLPLHAVLSYDGSEAWQGRHPADAEVLAAFHADQRRDKGLGPALGPGAHAALSARLAEAGYIVTEGRSDWQLEAPRDRALIAALAEGTAAAVEPALGGRARDWARARRAARHVTIGHRDLLALPRRRP